MLLFSRRDGDLRWSKRTRCARFDFHKNSEAIFLRDQINLAVWRADIACDDLISFGG